MRGSSIKIIVVLLALFLQVIVFGYFDIGGATIDVLLIVTVYFGFKLGMMSGQTVGFFSGLLEDVVSYKYFGLHMLIKTVLGAIIGKAHRKFFSESFLTVFMLLFFVSLLGNCMELYVKNVFFGVDVTWDFFVEYFVDVVIVEMLLNGFFAPFVFSFLDRFHLSGSQEF